MILVDTSAWIEFLRDTDSPICDRVEEMLAHDFAVADPIRMEVLAGARNEQHLIQLKRLLARGSVLHTSPIDYDQATALYRQCRANGETVRKLIDCLIAAVAIRNDIAILHKDADFEVLARHTALRENK
jgi:predicted nucleic acid-binding protein